MSVAGTIDAPLDIFGGLVTDMASADLPQGVSPDCADVAFIDGAVKTRPGLQAVIAGLAGNPTVNYLKTYIALNLTQRLLVLDALGNLWKETSPGGLSSVASGLAASAYCRSATLFGREYLAFSDGKFGVDIPRQFDDTNFDRVSQVGPGAPSSVSTLPVNISVISRTSNVVGVLTTAAHGFQAGQNVVIAGVTDASFNGTFTITAVTSSTNFNYAQAGVDTTSGGGTATLGPGVAEETSTFATIAASPTGAVRASVVASIPTGGAVRASNVATIRTSTNHGFGVGYGVAIAGVADSSFNGTFTITAVPTPQTFTYNQTASDSASGGGTATANVVTITTTVAHGFAVGWNVAIAAVTDASFNGTFTIGTLPSSTTFTYTQSGAAASSGGGTATANPIGNISPGVHKCVVIFKTRQGYLTAPSPPATWTASGGRRVSITSIPTGPSNVVARILAFTTAGGASYFYIGPGAVAPNVNMVIGDNTTTSLAVDFTDSALLAATNVDGLFKLIELGECAGVIDYAGRLFWWGERNKQNNWLNLSFDGGFNALGTVPLGWSADPTSGTGGSRETLLGLWGDAYDIIGDGATATRGLITQSAAKDINGVALIAPATAYSVRARVKRSVGLTQGTLHIHLFSLSGSVNTTGIQLTPGQLSSVSFTEFIAQLTPPLATIPSDLVLRVYVDGTPTAAQAFIVDNIEIYPTNQPYNSSLVRASRVEDPESYDGINGILSVAENNGQGIRAAFTLRSRLYFVKERSLFTTEDDGLNEPALWSIAPVSTAVGTPSVNGVGVGEDWVVIAAREGLYLFWGSEPVKISQEIQPTWDSINWQYGHTIWVKVDTRNKRILVGAPIGAGATSPNRVLVLDYRGLSTAEEIAAQASVHISSFTGKLFAPAKARKWAPWFLTANSAALVERSDGTAQTFLGNGTGTGKIYQLSDTQFSDDGAAINSYYTTYFFLHHELEQALQIGSHRKLFAYLTIYAAGSGALNLTAYADDTSFASALTPLSLSNPPPKDLELPINLVGERVAFRLGTNFPGAWFKLEKFIPSLRPEPWAPVRGVN